MPRRVEVTVRAVTPMFLGGAETRAEKVGQQGQFNPEARAMSLRGAIRWWLRALLAGTGVAGEDMRNPDTEKLWEAEARVFGSADEEHGGASPILVYMREEGPPSFYYHSDVNSRGLQQPFPVGLRYMFFGMEESGRRESNYRGPRQAYAPGTRLTITIEARRGARGAQEAFTRACASLWLLLAFGGLGARSRHGAGCMAVESVGEGWPENLPNPLNLARAGDARELLHRLREDLGATRVLIAGDNKVEGPPQLGYSSCPVLHPNHFNAFIFESNQQWRGWLPAVSQVGVGVADFRRLLAEDAALVKAYATGHPTGSEQSSQTVHKATLGLPIPYHYRNIPSPGQDTDVTLAGADHDRSPSPVAYHFRELADGRLVLVITHTLCKLLPQGEKLVLKGKANEAKLPQPSARTAVLLRDDLLNSLASHLGARLMPVFRQQS